MIRRVSPSDLESCMELATRVGWPKERRKWELLFRAGPGQPLYERLGFVHVGRVVSRAATSRLRCKPLDDALANSPHPREGSVHRW